MPASGDTVPSSDVNLAQQRNAGPSTIGVTDVAATSGTTEKVIDTITVPVVSGRKYLISYSWPRQSDATSTVYFVRIKEGTTIAGAQLNVVREAPTTTTQFPGTYLEVEWTASSTGNVSFCTTAQRESGAGNLTMKGATSQPRRLAVTWLGANA